MLKRLWQWYIRVPAGLDLADRLYLWGMYGICALIALNGPIFVMGAIISDVEVLVRLAMIAAAVAAVAAALSLRIFIFWMYVKRSQLFKHLGL